MKRTTAKDIDQYIVDFPPNVRRILRSVRQTIRAAAPGAKEKISYQIPTFTLHGNLVHFAAFEHHVGFYPGSAAIKEFRKQLSPYKSGKGSVQFPLDVPVPLGLVAKIVKFNVAARSKPRPRKRAR